MQDEELNKNLYKLFLELRGGQKVLNEQVQHIKEHLQKQNSTLEKHDAAITKLKQNMAYSDGLQDSREDHKKVQRERKHLNVWVIVTLLVAVGSILTNIIIQLMS